MLQSIDTIRIQPSRLIKPTQSRSDALLDIVRTRSHLALPLGRHPVRAAIDLSRPCCTCCRGVVKGESLDAEKAVVEQPFGKEALFGGDEGADCKVERGRRGAVEGLRLEGIFFFLAESRAG